VKSFVRSLAVGNGCERLRWFGAGARQSSSTDIFPAIQRTTTSVAVVASDFPTRTKNGTPFQRGESIVTRRIANVSVAELARVLDAGQRTQLAELLRGL
jgi:hypothetical protein